MSISRSIEGMPNEEYHSSPGVSKTVLDLVHDDGHYAKWAKDCPQDDEKLKTFDFGDAMHAICLEPDRLKSEFVVMPKFGLKAVDKAAKTVWLKEHEHLKVLTEDDHKKLTQYEEENKNLDLVLIR